MDTLPIDYSNVQKDVTNTPQNNVCVTPAPHSNDISLCDLEQPVGYYDHRCHYPPPATNGSFRQNPSVQIDRAHGYRRLPPAVHIVEQEAQIKFECITCKTQFAYESSAKRHQYNQIKRFNCKVCHSKFARLDYRNWHQRRCRAHQA
ncbi:hypothetical protein K439DRAFT_697568 [Ramaria rubella]|nr:hypothetical protein K439DRAFT_697568 [Ramaria rubella]